MDNGCGILRRTAFCHDQELLKCQYGADDRQNQCQSRMRLDDRQSDPEKLLYFIGPIHTCSLVDLFIYGLECRQNDQHGKSRHLPGDHKYHGGQGCLSRIHPQDRVLYDPQCLEKVIQHTVQIIIDPEPYHTAACHGYDHRSKVQGTEQIHTLKCPIDQKCQDKSQNKQARGHKATKVTV